MYGTSELGPFQRDLSMAKSEPRAERNGILEGQFPPVRFERGRVAVAEKRCSGVARRGLQEASMSRSRAPQGRVAVNGHLIGRL